MEIPILYALVSHGETSDYKTVASHSPSNEYSDIYKSIIVTTVKDLTSLEEEKISITRDRFTVHLLIGELYYACLTKSEGSPVNAARIAVYAQEFLEQVRIVYRDLPILVDLSRELENFVTIDLSAPLKKIMSGNNYREASAVPAIREELIEVRKVLLDSVEKLIDRGQKLDELIKKTQSLEITVHKDFRLLPKCLNKKKSICFASLATIVIILSSIAFGIFVYLQLM